MLQELLTTLNIIISSVSVGVSVYKYFRYQATLAAKKIKKKTERSIRREFANSVTTSPIRQSRVVPYLGSNSNSLQSIPEMRTEPVMRVSSPELGNIDRL